MRRLKTVRRPPIYPNGAQAISPVAPSPLFRCPHAVLRCPSVDSGLDGLGAMIGAWNCDDQAQESGMRTSGLPLMKEIALYNEIDCKAMMEIVQYLRENH